MFRFSSYTRKTGRLRSELPAKEQPMPFGNINHLALNVTSLNVPAGSSGLLEGRAT
jgi:hypothetical protein